MADHTPIEWTDATWNPITGCAIESPGCKHCYAMTLAGTRLRNHPSRVGLTTLAANGAYVWNGKTRLNREWLDQPVRWSRPRMIFVVAHGDLFYEKVPVEWIDEVFAIMALAGWHTYQVLTKRADRMADYMGELYAGRMYQIAEKWSHAGFKAQETIMASFTAGLPQCWLGVSAENQKFFDERVKHLREIHAAVRWISAEPLLGHIDARAALADIQWIVAGGESGSRARPSHPDWFRSLRDQCARAAVPFHFKQHGAWLEVDADKPTRIVESTDPAHAAEARRCDGFINLNGHFLRELNRARENVAYRGIARIGKKAAGRVLDGRTWDEFPRVTA